MKRFNEMLIEQNRIDAKAGKGSIRQIRAEFVIQFHFLAEKSWYQIDDPTRRKDWKPNMVWSKEKQEFYPSLRTVETYATVTFDELEKLYNEAGELHQQAIGKKNPLEESYTNKLLSDKSLSKEKVLEEIGELIEAVENDSNKIHEAADVFYHLIMYLEANNIKIEDVMTELDKRKK